MATSIQDATIKDRIEQAIRQAGRPMGPKEVCGYAKAHGLGEMDYNTVRQEMPKMTEGESPRLVRIERGSYDLPENVPSKEESKGEEQGAALADIGALHELSDATLERLGYRRIRTIKVGAGNDRDEPVNGGGLILSDRFIRQEYGVEPHRLCEFHVVGDSMKDTLQPGQKVKGVLAKGEGLRDGAVYALRGPLGYTVKRLRFDRKEGQPVIWIWSDNDKYADQRHYLTREAFEVDYDVIAWALEVGRRL